MKPRTSRAGEAGLTLLEILVVLAIAASLIAAAPWGSFSALERVELKALARDMAAELRAARAHARRDQTTERFLIDLDARTYGLAGRGAPTALPADVRIEVRAAREDLEGAATGAIVFAPDGSASGGSVVLTRANRVQKISVAWLTGTVTLEDG